MITNKKFIDTRTNEIVEQFNILDIKYMKELKEEDIIKMNEQENEQEQEKKYQRVILKDIKKCASCGSTTNLRELDYKGSNQFLCEDCVFKVEDYLINEGEQIAEDNYIRIVEGETEK
jgi:superfamily II helicase